MSDVGDPPLVTGRDDRARIESALEEGASVVSGRPMPPLFLRLRPDQVRYYAFHFLDDGYPAQRRADGSLYEHPLYPIYIVDEYIAQFRKTGSRDVLEAACTVADAALLRAVPFADGLVLWYDATSRVARATQRHFSALTQAYYAQRFHALGRLAGNPRYTAAALKFLSSLEIDVAAGGVARRYPEGIGLEELPLTTPELILNGWMSAVATVAGNKALLREHGVRTFVDRNLDLLEYLLPRYDCPDLLNSRYSLAAPCAIRLRANGPLTLNGLSIVYDDATAVPLGRSEEVGWTNGVSTKGAETSPDGAIFSRSGEVKCHLVLTRVTQRNTLTFRAKGTAGRITAEALVGQYQPLTTGPVRKKWRPFASLDLSAEERRYDIAISGPVLDLVGYPTNFAKVFGGKHRNVYHPIHINRLDNLFRYQDRAVFGHFVKRWASYMRDWPRDPRYRDVAMHDYATNLSAHLRGLLQGSTPPARNHRNRIGSHARSVVFKTLQRLRRPLVKKRKGKGPSP